jgi:hypothetical protein
MTITDSQIIAHLAQQVVELEPLSESQYNLNNELHDASMNIAQLKARVNDLEVALNNRDVKVAEAEAAAGCFKGHLDDIDRILGNCSAFDHCNGRQDKIRLAMVTAAKAEQRWQEVERLKDQLKATEAHRQIALKSYEEVHAALEAAGVRNAQNLMEVTTAADRVRMLANDRDLWRDKAQPHSDMWVGINKHTPFFYTEYKVRLDDGRVVAATYCPKGWALGAAQQDTPHKVIAWVCTEENVGSLIDDLEAAHKKLEAYRPLVPDWAKFENAATSPGEAK